MQNNPASATEAHSNDLRTPEEWEGIRDVLTKLYRDDNKTLREVRETLARQGFNAT
jgi:Clr5 domain